MYDDEEEVQWTPIHTRAGAMLIVWLLVVGACATPALGWPFPGPYTPPRGITQKPAKVIFFDDFNGRTLDTRKWQPNWLGPNNQTITKPVNTQEASCYDPRQVSVRGGYLRLRATKRSCRDNRGKTYAYASGLVNTASRFRFTYGRIEARVRLESGPNRVRNRPAVWANGAGKWPTTGEIDVFEGLNGNHCFHFHGPKGAPGGCVKPHSPGGWHTFAAEWRRGRVTFTFDGRRVGEITHGITNAPMYLVLNLGLSNSISPPIATGSELLVDYVKVTA